MMAKKPKIELTLEELQAKKSKRQRGWVRFCAILLAVVLTLGIYGMASKGGPNVVSVYIEAPRAFCLERTMEKMGVTKEVAAATIEKTDKFRADYYKYYTNGNYWTNPVNYDLTLNSEKVGIEDCVKLIKQYLIIKGYVK